MRRLGFKFRINDIGKQICSMSHASKLSLSGIGIAAMLMSVSTAASTVFGDYESLPIAHAKAVWLAEMSISDAVRLVERQTGGKVLSVNEEERGGRRVFRVKVLLSEGRVRTLFIDKQTGSQREG